jgi:hypothetical protein
MHTMHTVRSTTISAMILTAIVAAPSLAAERSGPTTMRRDLTFGTVAAYGGGALFGGALIAGVGWIGSLRAGGLYGGIVGACAGYSLGSAVGVTVAGALLKDNGRFLPSFAWAGVTMAASAGMFYGGGPPILQAAGRGFSNAWHRGRVSCAGVRLCRLHHESAGSGARGPHRARKSVVQLDLRPGWNQRTCV